MRKVTKNALPDEIELPVRFKLTMSPFKKSGTMHIRFADCIAEVYEGEIKLGDVCGVIGGGVEISEPSQDGHGITYYADAEVIWTAYQQAVAALSLAASRKGDE